MDKTCPNCSCELIIAPLSSLFDPSGEKFGGIWQCPRCNFHILDVFPTPEDIKKYKDKNKKKEGKLGI